MTRMYRRIRSLAYLVILTALLSLVAPFARAQVPEQRRPRTSKIPMNFASAPAVARSLQALPEFGPGSGITIQAHKRDNSLVVVGSDEQIFEVKKSANLMDIQPRHLMIKAETIVTLHDAAGHKHSIVMAPMAKTTGESPVVLKSTAEAEPASPTRITLDRGVSDLQIQARINGDNSITLDVEWSFDLSWKVPGQPKPLRLHNSYTTTSRQFSGATVCAAGTILKLGGLPKESEAEILLFLTSYIERSPQPAKPAGSRLDDGRLPHNERQSAELRP